MPHTLNPQLCYFQTLNYKSIAPILKYLILKPQTLNSKP